MPKLPLDLTGKRGLTSRYYGDKVYTTSKPNLRYDGIDGEMAEGIYNPLTVNGYMSPANDTTKAVTGTTSYLLSSGIVIPSRLATETTDAIFFSDEATTGTSGKIVNLDTAIDTSLDTALTFDTGTDDVSPTFSVTLGTVVKWVMPNFLINPASSTTPSIIYSTRGTSSSGTTITKSITVPSGTSTELVVISFNYTANTATGATWNGNAMTSHGSGSFSSGGTNISYNVFRYNAPTASTGDVVVTWAGSNNNLGVFAMVTDNTNQTTPLSSITSATGTATAVAEDDLNKTASNQLRFNFLLSETTSHKKTYSYNTEVSNENNTAGTDSFWYYNIDGTQYFRNEDFIKYSLNGDPKIFFARTDTTSYNFNSIGIADLDFSNSDVDWSIAEHNVTLSGRTRPVFILADNNLLYTLDGAVVYSIDGTVTGGATGAITQVLQFLGDRTEYKEITRLIDGIDLRGRLWIGLHVYPDFDTRDNSIDSITTPQFIGVYVWDRLSTVASMQDFIRISGAKEFKSMHSINGNPLCFTVSVDGYTQIREWNGSGFPVTKKLGKNAYPNYRRHSVYEDENGIMWLGQDGKIYFYGVVDGSDIKGLFIIGDMTGHVSSEQTYSNSGIFIPVNATETVTIGNENSTLAFYLSFSDSGGNHLKKWYPFAFNQVDSNNQIANSGNVYSLVKLLPSMSTVNNLVIRCAPTSTKSATTIATIKVYLNNSTTAIATKSVTDTEASRGYLRVPLNGQKSVNCIQIEVEWVAGTLGVDTFLPYMAILDYNETNIREK